MTLNHDGKRATGVQILQLMPEGSLAIDYGTEVDMHLDNYSSKVTNSILINTNHHKHKFISRILNRFCLCSPKIKNF